jgi:hypothetical protein
MQGRFFASLRFAENDIACPLLCSALIQSIMSFFEDWPHFERLLT